RLDPEASLARTQDGPRPRARGGALGFGDPRSAPAGRHGQRSRTRDQDQMDAWALEFDSWDLCDQVCGNLFDRTPYAFLKAVEWSWREEEFVRRAAFALMATSAVHNETAKDEEFEVFLPIIRSAATDERNYVKKAVNWALRQIGKRNANLNRKAI